jgi:Na+/proline symporter
MHSLNVLDYVIILTYMALSCCAGLLMARKASSSMEQYFLGGRSLPWWMLGVAGMANWFDLTGTMIITSFLYMLGPRGLYVEFRGGAVLVLAFLLCYAGKWHRRSGCMTSAEWMTYRFGAGKAAEGVRLLQAVVGVISAMMLLAYLIRGASLFMGMFFPYPPMLTTIILVSVTTLYTLSSGFYGVVMTDMVQGCIILISCFVISFMAWHMVPSVQSLQATALSVTGNANWTDSALPVHTTMPPGYEAYQPLMMIAMFYLVRNILGGMGVGAESRYFGARDDRECGLQSLLNGIMVMFRWPLMIGFAVMGIYLVHNTYPDQSVIQKSAALVHQYYPAITEADWHSLTSSILNAPGKQPAALIQGLHSILGDNWRGKLPLIGFRGDINPEQILPAVLMNQVPSGLKGMLVVAMFAAMMSANNGIVNTASALFVKDIYQNFMRPVAKTRELIFASYASTLAVVAVGFWVGATASSINDLWGWLIMSFTAGGLAPALLRLYWWRCNATGMFGGILLGGIGALVQRLVDPHMPEMHQFLIMTALSFAGTIGGSYLSEPAPMEVLRNFYRTTRPFGLWKPLRDVFQGEERLAVEREHRNDIIAVPFTLLWQVTLFMLPMELVIKAYHGFFMTLPLFLVAVSGMYWFWWRVLPPSAPHEGEKIARRHEQETAEPVPSH